MTLLTPGGYAEAGSNPEELRRVGLGVLNMLELGAGGPVHLLLDNAHQAVREGKWPHALYRCHLAAEQAARGGDTAGEAGALVCQATVQLAMADFVAAAESFQRAAQLFHLLAQPANEAAAALGYGFAVTLRQDLGNALAAYHRARGLLRGLARAERAAGNQERAGRYERRARMVRELMDRVLISPVLDPRPAPATFEVAVVVSLQEALSGSLSLHAPAAAAESDPLGEARPSGTPLRGKGPAVVVREFSIADEPFSLHGLVGATRPVVLRPGVEYFALAAPPGRWAHLGIERGDYLLLSCEAPPAPADGSPAEGAPREDPGWLLYRTAGGEVDIWPYPVSASGAATPHQDFAERRFRESPVELPPLPGESLDGEATDAADADAPDANAPSANAPAVDAPAVDAPGAVAYDPLIGYVVGLLKPVEA